MTSWWTSLNHWRRKSIASKSTWLKCFKSNRAVQLYFSHKKTKYPPMTCYVMNYTSPSERTSFSLTHFLHWFPSKHHLSLELNSKTRGRLKQSIYMTLREKRAWIKYQSQIWLHIGVLMQSIESPRDCIHHSLWVSKSEVPFVLIIVQPRDKLVQTMTLDRDTHFLLPYLNGRMSRLISLLGFFICFQRSYKGLLF